MAARYELLEVIGSGGCAEVVRARRLRDGPDGEDVALKVLRPEFVGDAAVLRRFRDEARILSSLNHPYVVRGHELLDYDGRLVLELEFVRGATLEKVLGTLGPVAAPVAFAVVRQAAEALMAAWEAPGSDGRPMRIVHRDLKPANLAISSDGILRLLDFGYAKGDFEGRAAQSLHDVWGTVGYDAPELKQGKTSPAADVYALGVTLYVALTTRAMLLSTREAHHDEDLAGVLASLEQSVEHPSGIATADLADLVRDCMHFDASKRVSLPQLVARLDALVPEPVATDALADFGRHQARALWLNRLVIQITDDHAYATLRFLEERSPTPTRARLDGTAGRAAVEALLAEAGWERRVADFDPILDASEDLPASPFLGVLDRAAVPFWKPWVAAASPAEVEAALLLLLRLNPEIARERAKDLLTHPGDRVRDAARFVLGMDEAG